MAPSRKIFRLAIGSMSSVILNTRTTENIELEWREKGRPNPGGRARIFGLRGGSGSNGWFEASIGSPRLQGWIHDQFGGNRRPDRRAAPRPTSGISLGEN